jgi:peptide/nickel transport system permease protein
MTLKGMAAGILSLYALFFTFAGFFSTASPIEMNPTLPYLPPEGLQFRTPSGSWHLHPFILRHRPIPGRFGEYSAQETVSLPLEFFAWTAPTPEIASPPIRTFRLCGLRGEYPGDSPHFLGTDQYGRDIWSRLIFGGRTTLAIGLAASVSATFFALLCGISAGLFGGWVDAILMRLTEIMISVPWFYLLLAVRAMLPLRTSATVGALISTSLLALLGWARPAKILRGTTLEARQRGYVTLASAIGASPWHLVRRHLLPDVLAHAVTQFTVLLPQFVASEVALSYFGLGVDEPLVSWGTMLTAAQHLSSILDYPWVLAPAWAMIPLFYALHEVVDHLRVSHRLTNSSRSRQNTRTPLENE